MNKLVTLFAFVLTSFAFAQDEKPKLNLYLYEQGSEDSNTEIVFVTDFPCVDPTTQPFVRALGVASAFAQSAVATNRDLTKFFAETDQPRDLADHISQLKNSVRLRFILPAENLESSVDELIANFGVMPAQVGNIDRMIHEEIKEKLARVVSYFDKSRNQLDKAGLVEQLFETLPLDSLNHFMKRNFSKAESHLIIACPKNDGSIKRMIAEKIAALDVQWKTEKQDSAKVKKALAAIEKDKAVAKMITHEGESVVVDGKIYMDPPSYWQVESTAVKSGIALLVLGIIFAIFTFGLSFIALGIPGILLLCDTYLADPQVIERKRVEISQNGYYYAHAQQCVGVAITPYERRQLFVNDIFKRYPCLVTRKVDFAAYPVLKVYNFNALEVRQFLYAGERDQLKEFQTNFYKSLSGIERQIDQLNAELANLLMPYQIIRDADIVFAQSKFDNHPDVIQRENYIMDAEFTKEAIERDYQRGFISREMRDGKMRSVKDTLELQLSSLEYSIRMAENNLSHELARILAQYDINKINCKRAINYDARMNALGNGEWDIYAYYNALATQYIMEEMNPNDSNFPDFLDLRAKR